MMKTNTASNKQQLTKPAQQQDHGKRAQNKDNLDSRENEEQSTKGEDITHNRKEKRSENKK